MRSLLLSLAAALILTGAAHALDIVAGGQSAYTIVTADAPTQPAAFAAQELAAYLQRITGATLPIAPEAQAPAASRIFVGPCAAAQAAGIVAEERESYRVRVVGADLFIVGEDTDGDPLGTARTGTLYGVYELLREFGGVRWLWPGELGEVVPPAPDFRVPDDLDRTVAPDFAIRHLWLTYRNPPEVRERYMRWYRRTGQGQALTGNSGHSYTSRLGGNSRFDEHPEYYALRDGQRRPFYGEGMRAGQLCTSNPEVVRIVAESALTDSRDIAPVAPNDGSGFCECPNCRALDVDGYLMPWGGGEMIALTDRIFTFVNQVAHIVAERDPEQLLGHYAYTFFKPPPARIDDLEDNIVLFFAQACHWFRNPELKADYRGYIDAWARYGNPMVSREYLGLIYWLGMPNIHTRRIEEEVAYLKERGFIGLNSEMCDDFSTHGPNYYLAARMIWDTDLTREEVLDDYYRAGFGPAAADVAEYYDTFERRLEELGPEATGSGSVNRAKLPMQFSPETIAQARATLDRAYTRTDDPTIHARLDFVKLGLDYTDVTTQLMRIAGKLNSAGTSLGIVESVELAQQPTEQQFIAWLQEALALHERRWTIIDGQGDLPALHRPALEEAENQGRWGDRIRERLAIVRDEAGRYVQLPLQWRFRVEGEGDGEAAGWEREDLDDSGWELLATNMPWEKQGHEGLDGVGWYRARFDLTAEQAASPKVVLRLGAIDEDGWAWLNGDKVGEIIFDVDRDPDSWKEPLDLDVTGRMRAGSNTVAVRVRDRSGAGGLWQPSYLILGEERANLLGNPSFEDAASGWSLSGKGEITNEVAAGAGYESEHALRIIVPADPDAHASMTTSVPAEAGHRYAFSFHYQTAGVGTHPTITDSPKVRVIFRRADGSSVTDTRGYMWAGIKVPPNTDDWQEANVYFATPPETASISITTFFHLPGSYLVDEVRLRDFGAVEG